MALKDSVYFCGLQENKNNDAKTTTKTKQAFLFIMRKTIQKKSEICHTKHNFFMFYSFKGVIIILNDTIS